MADLEDATPAEDEPDLSDLSVVTVNVETRAGRQLSMVWAAEGDRLSMTPPDIDGDTGLQYWTFTVIRSVG